MLDQSTRVAILKLREQGHSIRGIARAMHLSRGAVRQVLRLGSDEVPRIIREEKATPYRDEILELYQRCNGNLVRVHEELLESGARLSYQALTAFCRRQGIGQEPKKPVGEYPFQPGQEMQHDTSPHKARIDGRLRDAQTASLALCYSRVFFFELSPTFTRFQCKIFLDDAFHYNEGVCETCMIDNTHLVVLKGTGHDMIPVPEMAAFADRYGFRFQAHEKGDANRSAHVERRFSFIENNFLAGRSFCDWEDANRQAREWCDRVNTQYRRYLKASPRELFAFERPYLKPLPIWIPPIYLLHHRLVDVEGMVSVDTNRYSVPNEFIGLTVEVRQTKDTIEIYRGPRLISKHKRVVEPTGRKYRLPEHRYRRGEAARHSDSSQEKLLLTKFPEIELYVEALKKRGRGRANWQVRRLLRMFDDYPRQALFESIQSASQYGLYDLQRLETMVLRKLAREYFQITPQARDGADE